MTLPPLPQRYVHHSTPAGGGMSDVAVCRDSHLERLVFVKGLAAGIDNKRLLDELAALLGIRSKYVVQIYDVLKAADGSIGAIVEEYLPGDDLTKTAPPKNADEFVKIVYAIAEGIADIHAHKRVHRDIKPLNMKYDAEGCLKIFDFGLARLEDVDANTIGISGTPGYLAPELFLADANGLVEFTAAVDVFAFGCTALAVGLGGLPIALKGVPPIVPNPVADFSNLPFAIPDDVRKVLNHCFDANPIARPTMRVVADTIKPHLLRDQHKALLVDGSNVYSLDANEREVTLEAEGKGAIRIVYNGFRFVIDAVSGQVSINNQPAIVGVALPGSCVIILGGVHLGNKRIYITVDVSHPEVAL